MNDIHEAAGLHRFPLARRGMVMSALITGLTLATHRVEAQSVYTNATGLVAGEVQVMTDLDATVTWAAQNHGKAAVAWFTKYGVA